MSDLKTAVAKDTWPSNVTVFASSHRSEESKMSLLGSHYTRCLRASESLPTLGLTLGFSHGLTINPLRGYQTPQQSSNIAYLPHCLSTFDCCHGFIVAGKPNNQDEAKIFVKDMNHASRIMRRMGVPKQNEKGSMMKGQDALVEYLKKLDTKYKDSPDRGKQEVYLYFTGHGLATVSESGHLKGMQYLMDKKGMDERKASLHMRELRQELGKADDEKDKEKRQKMYKDVYEKYAKIGLTSDKDFDGKFQMEDGFLYESELKALVKKHCKDFGKVVIIMDSCHSGSFTAQNKPEAKDKDPLGSSVRQRDVLC